MKPRNDEDAVVDVLDVILRDGAVLQADVMIGIADIPLVGINLRAAIAGMTTMTEYGYFEAWDEEIRLRSADVDPPPSAPAGGNDRSARSSSRTEE